MKPGDIVIYRTLQALNIDRYRYRIEEMWYDSSRPGFLLSIRPLFGHSTSHGHVIKNNFAEHFEVIQTAEEFLAEKIMGPVQPS